MSEGSEYAIVLEHSRRNSERYEVSVCLQKTTTTRTPHAVGVHSEMDREIGKR